MLLQVIDERRRPCFHCLVVNPLSISNRQLNTDWNSKIKNYLELTNIGVCKTVVIFARFDSYYVNWTFSKIWHFGIIDLWFDLDQKWFGFDLIICDLIFDLRFSFKSFLQMILICTCDLPITASYRAWRYAELAISSPAVAKTIANEYCTYPQRDGQAEWARIKCRNDIPTKGTNWVQCCLTSLMWPTTLPLCCQTSRHAPAFNKSFIMTIMITWTPDPGGGSNEEHSLFAANSKVRDVAVERPWCCCNGRRRRLRRWATLRAVKTVKADSGHRRITKQTTAMMRFVSSCFALLYFLYILPISFHPPNIPRVRYSDNRKYQ